MISSTQYNLLIIYNQQFKRSTKMSETGYAKERFPNLQGQIFDCLICLEVVRDPKECLSCGNLFCDKCITDWMRKNASCPNRCPGSNISKMTAKALIKIYEDLDIKCSKCPKSVKLGDLQKHEDKCGLAQCKFSSECDGFEDKAIQASTPVCSEKCAFLQKLLDTKGDQKKMYELIKGYAPTGVQPMEAKMGKGSKLNLLWNQKHCGMNVIFTEDNTSVYLKEEAYVFRSVVATEGFMSGCHYWEIHADARTENELKIGVTSNNMFDFNTAFCDHKFGFAFYGLAQLRHGSNATGPQYGKRFKKNGILGVYLNMNNGSMSFSLNGEDMGIAYFDNDLKKGPLYPAVALLHCAGCIIKGELPVPSLYQGK